MQKENVQITILSADHLRRMGDLVMDEIEKFSDRIEIVADSPGSRYTEFEVSVYIFIPQDVWDVDFIDADATDLVFFTPEFAGDDMSPLFKIKANVEPINAGPYGSADYTISIENLLEVPRAGIRRKTITTYVGEKYSVEDFMDTAESVVFEVSEYLYGAYEDTQ